MNFKAAVNRTRRNFMRSLTSVIVKDNANLLLKKNAEVRRILICRPNSRLGNQIMISPLIMELHDIFPDAKVDLFVRGGLSSILFKNYEYVSEIIKLPGRPFKNPVQYVMVWVKLRKYRYDLVINAVENSSSGRLATRFVRSNARLFCMKEEKIFTTPDALHMAKAPVIYLRDYLSKSGIERNGNPVPAPDLKLNAAEIQAGRELLNKIANPEKGTISVFTFATGSKCYSKEWWSTVYQPLKTRYGQSFNIVEVLPKENVSQIDFAEPSFYSLDIREIGAFMANTRIFIGADSGMMHLASAVNVPVIGLFSVTNSDIYKPYNDNSVAINTLNSSVEDIMRVVDSILGTEGN
jgi:ADP-heptose:LPS heptosyltransferase